MDFIKDLQDHSSDHKTLATIPTDSELRDWEEILIALRSDSVLRCRALLQKYNYTVSELSDPVTGNDFLVLRENSPITRGWGTYLYNIHHKKRLFIHVQYPGVEFNTLQIGGDLFRRLDAELLFIAGPLKTQTEKTDRKFAHPRKSVFTRWHEMVTDLVHLTVSVRGIPSKLVDPPDVVVSNGRTADEQWGISQLSLTLRDSLRDGGFRCILAMFDSDYSTLAGASSREGIFSNDSVGFGHWLSLSVSPSVRANPTLARHFIQLTGRALDVTGKRISQQVNRAFGLVTPRVVKIDSMHGMMFPPASGSDYRIVSFRAGERTSDSINTRMGSWIDLARGSGSVTTIAALDSGASAFGGTTQKTRTRRTTTAIVQSPASVFPASLSLGGDLQEDTSRSPEHDRKVKEPLQMHRIPLRQVPVPAYAPQIAQRQTPFSVNEIAQLSSASRNAVFQMDGGGAVSDADREANYLVPLINCRFETEEEQYIGIHVNAQLVDEISHIVAKHGYSLKDIELTAEQQIDGGYCLRLIPHQSLPKPIRDEIARKF